MKIIDLLNKIANGEEVPMKIKFRDKIYRWFKRDENLYNYKQEYNGSLINNYLCDDWFMDCESILNDEVEILEEEKKIPKKIKIGEKSITVKGTTFFRDKDIEIFQKLSMEINEIIDYLDYLKSKGE